MWFIPVMAKLNFSADITAVFSLSLYFKNHFNMLHFVFKKPFLKHFVDFWRIESSKEQFVWNGSLLKHYVFSINFDQLILAE